MRVLALNAARICGKIHRNCALSAILGAVERARVAVALAGAAAVRSSAHAEITCPEPLPLPVTHFVPANSSARMPPYATNELRTGHSRGKTNGRESTVTTMARARQVQPPSHALHTQAHVRTHTSDTTRMHARTHTHALTHALMHLLTSCRQTRVREWAHMLLMNCAQATHEETRKVPGLL